MTSPRAERTGRIVFLHPSDEAYGADRVLLQMAIGLRDRGWRVAVLLSDDEGPGWLSEQLGRASIEFARGPLAPARRRYLRPTGLPSYLLALLRARQWVRSEVLRLEATIIHVNTSALLVGAILGRPSGAELVWHVHEILVRPRPLVWILRFAPVASADRVIAVSRAVRAHIAPGGIRRRRVSVVWNGLDDREPMPRDVDEAPVVAFIGRLNRWKGWEVFVEAVLRVSGKFPEARFLVAGDPPRGEEWRASQLLERVSRLGLEQRVEVMGFVRDVPGLLEHVDVVAVPSTWPEPCSIVTLEAMRAGRAVVATAIGGAVDLIEHRVSGLLIPPRQPRALAEAIEELLDDRNLRQRLGAAAQRRARRAFSSEAFIDGIEDVYERRQPRTTLDATRT